MCMQPKSKVISLRVVLLCIKSCCWWACRRVTLFPLRSKQINISLLGVFEDDASVTAEQQGLEENRIIDRILKEEKFKGYKSSRRGDGTNYYYYYYVIWFKMMPCVVSFSWSEF